MTKTLNFMHVTDRRILESWAERLRETFPTELGGPFHVGSSLTSREWRDVDLVTILDDAEFDALAAVVDIDDLNLAFSLWGQRVTGLPIDFKVQRQTDANEEFPGVRSAIGIGRAVRKRT